MRLKSVLTLPVLIAAIFSLSSCSGLKDSTPCTNCTPTGNATVATTIFDAPPTNVNLLSFTLPIIGISLTNASGSQVSLYAPSSPANIEMTKLQTDSALLTTAATVTADTYTAVNITVGASNGIFINASGATVGACVNGAVCGLPSGAATTITYTFTSPLVLTSNQSQWLGLDFNLNNAITTSTTTGVAINFSSTGVLTATTTTRTGLPSGAADTIEDFIGTVTAYTVGSTITVQNGVTGATMTAALSSNTEYDTPPSNYSNCPASPTCLTVGSTVSMNANLSSAGALTATEVDVLDTTATNEVEGVIYPTSTTGVYGMILADKVVASATNVPQLTSATYGAGISLTLSPTVTFSIDTGTLSPVLLNPVGFAGTSDILTGQVVRAQISSATTSGTNGINATATALLLRSSRITATVNTTSGTAYSLTNTPAYLGNFSITPQVQTYLTNTLFDGITGTGDLSVGQTVATRGLYLDAQPTFQALKVRVPAN
jgi:Domain of unknown function (DUF4382)